MTDHHSKGKAVKVARTNTIRPPLPAANVALVQTLLDRVAALARIWSPYTAYVAVLTIIALPTLQLARSESVVWTGSILLVAMCAPLVERYISK